MIMKHLIVAIFLFSILSPAVYSQDCQFEITGNDKMQFNLTKMTMKLAECKQVTVSLKHIGKMQAKVMGHNWVLTKTDDMMPVVQAGMTAGAKLEYLPEDRAKIIAATKMIGGGETDTITFSTDKLTIGGDYTFFCSFPGHFGIMKGSFVVQ